MTTYVKHPLVRMNESQPNSHVSVQPDTSDLGFETQDWSNFRCFKGVVAPRGTLSKSAMADWPKLTTGSGQAPRTPTGVRIWCGRRPGVARYRSHTPGYHPRTPPACKSASPEGWREISPGWSASDTRGCSFNANRTPEGCEDNLDAVPRGAWSDASFLSAITRAC